MRTLIKDADPDVVEERKWMGTPVWSHDGIICAGESYEEFVTRTFSKSASPKDPAGGGAPLRSQERRSPPLWSTGSQLVVRHAQRRGGRRPSTPRSALTTLDLFRVAQ